MNDYCARNFRCDLQSYRLLSLMLFSEGDDKPESLIRVERLANGKTGKKKEVTFYLMDILEEDKLLTIFQEVPTAQLLQNKDF